MSPRSVPGPTARFVPALARAPHRGFQLAVLLAGASCAMAQDISVDEDVLFADTSSIADSASLAAPASAEGQSGDRKSVGFSGNILTVAQSGVTRDYFDELDVEESNLVNSAVADLALDVRMSRGFKAFADLEWSYTPTAAGAGLTVDSGAAWRMPEMFLDANINHRAYFRVGKQVLQWGRTYFFNPTDLINVERRSFFRRIGSREGVYGAKAHIPFGTAWNLYGFLDAHRVERPDSLGGAFKVERLWGRTEMAVMAWGKGGYDPVYGADLSTRVLGLDLSAELALHQSVETRTLDFSGGRFQVNTDRDEWAPRASMSLGRSFRVSGIQDRLMTVGEYYYNGPGSSDRRLGLAAVLSALGGPGGMGGLPGGGLTGAGGMQSLAASGFYQPNSISQHYAAFFATFNRFLRRDLTLTFNAIGNLNQSCAMLSSGIAYRDLNDFGLSFWAHGFAGPEDTEYTLANQAVQVQVILEAAF